MIKSVEIQVSGTVEWDGFAYDYEALVYPLDDEWDEITMLEYALEDIDDLEDKCIAEANDQVRNWRAE